MTQQWSRSPVRLLYPWPPVRPPMIYRKPIWTWNGRVAWPPGHPSCWSIPATSSLRLQYAIQNPINGITIPIISQSYGACEAASHTCNQNTIEGWLEQANSQGQTVVLASGDTGAADCDELRGRSPSATQGLAVDYPGSSVYVTDLRAAANSWVTVRPQTPQTGAGTYWSANGTGSVSDDLITSAKSYIPEMAWNDTTFSIANRAAAFPRAAAA